MAHYAEKTSVPAEKSRANIERLLERYGAEAFMYAQDRNRSMLYFQAHGRHVRFVLPMPDPDDERFRKTPTRGSRRSPEQQKQAYQQEVRRRWRSLELTVKAKLEAVETGITDFESAFLAHIVLPDRKTVGDHMRPQIADAYDSGAMPAMLPWYGKE